MNHGRSIGFASLLAALALAAPAKAATPGPNGPVAYVDNNQLFALYATTQSQLKLVFNPAGGAWAGWTLTSPAISPDGRTVAFAARKDCAGCARIATLPIDGSGQPKVIVDGGDSAAPSWSPDGRELIYSAQDSLKTVKATGGEPTPVPLPDTVTAPKLPAFSPDGTRIAFSGIETGGTVRHIFVRTLATGAVTQITSGAEWTDGPAWSPGGDRLAYAADRRVDDVSNVAGSTKVIARPLDGGAPEVVYSSPDVNSPGWVQGRPAWSPDGKAIAVSTYFAQDHNACKDHVRWVFLNGDPAGDKCVQGTEPGGLADLDWGVLPGNGDIALLTGHLGSATVGSNGATYDAIVSGNGRYAVVTSRAWDLVPGLVDRNEGPDVFRRDLATGKTVPVSVKPDGTTPDPGFSENAVVSTDGRWVAFDSTATGLVSGDEIVGAVYLRDVENGTTELVSRLTPDSHGMPGKPLSISDDGQYVLYASGDGPIFRYDRATQRAQRVDTDGANGRGFMTPDGRYVAFGSVAGVFRRDMSAGGETELVSNAHDAPEVDGISDDGSTVLWRSGDPGIVPGFVDNNGPDSDLYIRRLGAPAQLVTGKDGSATQGSGGAAFWALLSADGKTVVFTSDWIGYDAGAQEYHGNHFHAWARRFDPAPAGKAELVPGNWATPNVAGDGDETAFAVSADGRYVLAQTTSSDVLDPPVRSNDFDVLVRVDRVAHRTTAVTALDGEANDDGVSPGTLSRDGRVATFITSSRNLVKGFEDNNDRWADSFVWSDESLSGSDPLPPEISLKTPADGAVYRTGRVVLADYSCSDEGASGLASCDGTIADGQPLDTSKTGSFAFTVTARDGAGNTTTKTVHYRVAEPNDRIVLASRKAGGAAGESADGGSGEGVLSADGRYLVFESRATNLVPGYVNGNLGATDVYRRDLQTGATQLVSGVGTRGGNGFSRAADTSAGRVEQSVISADGRYVLFESASTDLIDGFSGGAGGPSLYLRDMQTGEIRLVDHARGNPKQAGDGFLAYDYWLSRDGSKVAFRSTAKNLVAAPSSGRNQIYVYDVATGAVSSITGDANGDSGGPELSADGRRLIFESTSTDLIAGHPQELQQHVYWRDLAEGVTRLVDHRFDSDTTGTANGGGLARLSADGRTVLFESQSDDVISGMSGHDSWNGTQLYTRDMVNGGAARLITSAFDDPKYGTGGGIGSASLSDDGTTVVWRSRAARVVAGFADHNGDYGFDIYVRRGAEPARLAAHGPGGPADGYPKSLNAAGLSADGRLLAFTIGDTVTEGPEEPVDVRRADLLRDRVVSVVTAPDHWIGEVQMSLDGQRIALEGNAQNLVDGFVDGNGDEGFDVFTWSDAPPVAKATSRVTGPLAVRFDASESADPDGRLVDYRWDFGDGASGTGVTATHAYAAEGTYTVKLTVEDDGAHEVSTTIQVIAIKGVLAADGQPFDFLGVDRGLACNAGFAGGTVSCATLAAYGGVVYGPGATAFTPVSQEESDGRLVTVVALGTTGVRLRQTDAYKAGEGWYRTDVSVLNDGDDARGVTVYRFARCALGAPATRASVHDAATAMAGCSGGTAVGALLPLTAGARHESGAAGAVLADVVAGGALSNACDCASAADPGAAIGWKAIVPGHGELSRASVASFGPDGSIPVTVSVAPEKDAVQPLDDNAFTVTLRNPNAAATAAGGLTVTPDAWDYVAGSSSGLSTADPASAGGKLSWSGDWSVPGHGGASLRLAVAHRAGERVSTTTALATGGRFAGVTSASLADIAEAKASVDVRSDSSSVPNTAIYGGPTGATNDDSPSFELAASKAGVHYECRLGGDWGDCTTPYEPGPLRDGSYSLEVRAADAVGTDPTPATRGFVVDTIAPNTTIATGPRAVTTDPRPIFELRANEPGARFECRFGGEWRGCESTYRAGLMADGTYAFEARAIDAAGNADPTPARWEFEIDTTPPVTVIDGLDGDVLASSAATPSASSAGGGSRVAVGGDGAATLEVACPADSGASCTGTVGLATDPGGDAKASIARAIPDGSVPLARADFDVAPGKRAAVKLPLNVGVRNRVEREGRLPVFVTLDPDDGKPVRGGDLTLTPDPRTARFLDAGRELQVVRGAVALRLYCAAKCSGRVTLAGRTKRFSGRRIKVRMRVTKRGTQSVRITTKPALTKRLSVTLRAKEARR